MTSILCPLKQVRQGLKKFSNWPTYPQLYVDGELIGGVDVVKVTVIYIYTYYVCSILCMCIIYAGIERSR